MLALKKLKRKTDYLLERIKLPESNYLDMKTRAKMFDDMMSAVTYSLNADYEDAIDIFGNVVARIYKDKIITLDVDVIKMLAAGGITFDKNSVQLNIIGFKKEDD
jgi:hypothetical protein